MVDPSTWGTLEQAMADNSANGVGFVLTRQDPFIALDLDKALANGQPTAWAAEILSKAHSYTEVSQSGAGLHVIATVTKPLESFQRKWPDQPGHLEVYYSARYIAITGELFGQSPLEPINCEDLVLEIAGPTREPAAQRWVAATAGELALKCAWLAHCRDDAETLNEPEWYAMLSVVGRCSDGSEAAHEWSQSHPKYSRGDTESKLQRAILVAGPRTCAGVIREFGDDYCHGCGLLGKIKTPLYAVSRPRGAPPVAAGGGADPATLIDGFHCTDSGNGDRIIRAHGREIVAYHAWSHPLVWDGRVWGNGESAMLQFARDSAQSVMDLLEQPMSAEDAARTFKWAQTSESIGRLNAAIEVARRDPRVQIESPAALNRDPYLLNCRNGVVDLRTGKLLRHDPKYLLSEMADVEYDEDAVCPTWMSFLSTSVESTDVRQFLQVSAGYSLTGMVGEKVLFFLHGPGNSGKTTFVKTLSSILGTYARIVSQDLLMARSWNNHPTELANLYGARMAVASETEEGHRLNESLLKLVTGGDEISARRMREDFWSFNPTHKFWMIGNHKPVVRGTDDAIWNRLLIVPFSAPATLDRLLGQKLSSERPGILAWAVRGCLRWISEGLSVPSTVLASRERYRAEQDVVGLFLAESILSQSDSRMEKTGLYRAYKAWAEGTQGDRFPLSRETFNRRVSEKGWSTEEENGTYYWGAMGFKPIPLEVGKRVS